jgi:hypothetical protein
MAQWVEITEENRDEWSRRGVYLYLGTKLSHEQEQVHREDGPAIVTPDGVERWYVRGQEITVDVKTMFRENQWNLSDGLDTPSKLSLFASKFLG